MEDYVSQISESKKEFFFKIKELNDIILKYRENEENLIKEINKLKIDIL